VSVEWALLLLAYADQPAVTRARGISRAQVAVDAFELLPPQAKCILNTLWLAACPKEPLWWQNKAGTDAQVAMTMHELAIRSGLVQRRTQDDRFYAMTRRSSTATHWVNRLQALRKPTEQELRQLKMNKFWLGGWLHTESLVDASGATVATKFTLFRVPKP